MSKVCLDGEPLKVCTERFDAINEKLEEILGVMRGDKGDADKSMMTRMIKIEGAVAVLSRITWIGVGAVIVAVATAIMSRVGVS